MKKENSEIKNEVENLLNDEFFTVIKTSKKINDKTKKIKQLNEYFKTTPNYHEIPEIKNKIPDLYNLLLTNLNENNNNYVLSQMELIKTLCNTNKSDESFHNFIKQSIPKLFDKFYLQNTKINDSLIVLFSNFISSNSLVQTVSHADNLAPTALLYTVFKTNL